MTNKSLTQTTLALAVLAAVGRNVLASEGETSHTFKIASLDTEKSPGTMKDKSKEHYVVLQRSDDTAVVVSLHPKNAAALLAGEETAMGGVTYKLEQATEAANVETKADDAQAASLEAQADAHTAEGAPSDQVGEGNSAAADAAEGAQQTEAGAADATPAVKAKKDKGPSKKDQAVDIYIEMANDGKGRGEIIKAFLAKIPNMTPAGAATYYQNCTSFKDGWTIRPDADEGNAGEAQSADAADGAAAGSTDANDVAGVSSEAKADETAAAE